MSKERLPSNLLEAIRYFSDLDVCIEFVAGLRWPNGPVCPKCGGVEYSYLTTRRLWKCKACQKQYSVKVGTIFEDSALGLAQKSTWFMLHRIRLAMQTGSFDKLSGTVEVDETFIGGKARNMHKHIKARKIRGTGTSGKTTVLGMI